MKVYRSQGNFETSCLEQFECRSRSVMGNSKIASSLKTLLILLSIPDQSIHPKRSIIILCVLIGRIYLGILAIRFGRKINRTDGYQDSQFSLNKCFPPPSPSYCILWPPTLSTNSVLYFMVILQQFCSNSAKDTGVILELKSFASLQYASSLKGFFYFFL